MIGRANLTFSIEGGSEDEIRAAGLELKRLFNEAAARRVSGFEKGILTMTIDGAPAEPEAAPDEDRDHPERLFDA